jgi:predicted nucleic acid-binding protein
VIAVFADTSFYVALLNRRDVAHHHAVALSRRHRAVATSEYVLLEVANWFAQSAQRAAFAPLVQRIQRTSTITVVESSHALFERGIQLYAARPDKAWSLTDCTSMAILEDLKLTSSHVRSSF